MIENALLRPKLKASEAALWANNNRFAGSVAAVAAAICAKKKPETKNFFSYFRAGENLKRSAIDQTKITNAIS